MIVSVASVKGGSGKTLISTGLALCVPNCRFLDCDVEEPDGHLYLRPTYRKRERVTINVPRPKNWFRADLRPSAEVCPYNALAFIGGRLMVFNNLCTGCGACFFVAPKGALTREEHEVGAVKTGEGRNGVEVVTVELRVGSQRTGRVVTAVMKKVERGRDTIIDCPPGTARPVREAIRGSDYCVLVTEASPFGLEDLKAGVEALRLLNVKFGVVLNMLHLTDAGVGGYCKTEGVPVLLEIPFSRAVAEASSRGKALLDISPHWASEFGRLWERIGAQ
jgi:MinD superfamily P-loop ATPase